MRSQKVAEAAEVMIFTEDEAVKFWPIYQEYQAEIAKLTDRKLGCIKDYANNYEKMTEAKARELADLALQLEADLVGVEKKYTEKIREALSPKMAGRFLQVENPIQFLKNQIQFLMDLQIGASLPVIQ